MIEATVTKFILFFNIPDFEIYSETSKLRNIL